MTTVLLADDHAIVRRGFSMILAAQPDFRIVAEVSNGREAVEQAEKLQPTLCVMDVSMPDLNGIEATRRMLKVSPRTRVIAVSMHKDSVYVREILRAGAKGYVLKDSNESEFLKEVRAVSVGKGYLSPEIAASKIDMPWSCGAALDGFQFGLEEILMDPRPGLRLGAPAEQDRQDAGQCTGS